MKRSLLAAAALMLMSTVAASALELNCDAPRVALGDDPRDNNPVINVDIRYIPSDHQWRVFHKLRDGLVVSRSEQYAIQDATNGSTMRWQGSLNRVRNLYMIGEIRRDEGGLVYMEWLYDRNKNNLLVMQASARCAPPPPALPQPTPAQPSLPQPTAPAASVNNQVTLRNAGYWTAYYDPSNSDGKPMCGMISRVDAGGGSTGGVMVKYVPGSDLFVQIYKSNWAIPAGTDIPVYLQFDNGQQYTATAGGGPAPKSAGSWVYFNIADSFSKSFIEQFATASTMTLGFQEGSERPWSVNMTGGTEVAESFRKCGIALAQTPKVTQPYSGNTTQPFDNNKGATQPFGGSPTQPQSKPATSKRDNGGI